MGKPFIDLTNQQFGLWFVTGPHKSVPRPNGKGGRTHWFCTCQCENKTTRWVDATNLKSGISTNCGCQRIIVAGKGSPAAIAAAKARTKHGMSQTRIYRCYRAMMQRCYNRNARAYRWYGATGITVCDRWKESCENFFTDMGPTYAEGLTLERIDVSKGYSPENCKWIPLREQAWNKKYHLIEGVRLRRFCFEHGLDYDSFYYHIVKKGLSLIDVLALFKVSILDGLPDINPSESTT